MMMLARDPAGVKPKHAAYKGLFDGKRVDRTKSRVKYRFPTNKFHDLTISLSWKRLRLILSVMKIGPVPGETEGDPDGACLELTTSALLSNSKVSFIHSATDQVRNGLAKILKKRKFSYLSAYLEVRIKF